MIFAHLKIHVEQIKEIVTLMMNARMAFPVDQTIVQIPLDFMLSLTAAMPQQLEMNIFVHLEYLVEKMQEIVTQMMNVRMVFYVDQTIVQRILAFILNLIAVMPQLLEMNIFVHLEYLVEKMKEIAIQIMNVKTTLSVILLVAAQNILNLQMI